MSKGAESALQLKNAFWAKCLFAWIVCATLFLPVLARSAPIVDLSAYESKGQIAVTRFEADQLRVEWPDKSGGRYRAVFNLETGRPLFAKLDAGSNSVEPLASVATNVDIRYRVTFGTRHKQAGWPYIFFDKVYANSPTPVSYLSKLELSAVRVISESRQRIKIVFSSLKLGDYSGDLICHVYAGSPFLETEACMYVDKPWVAYIYDALLYADFEQVSYWDDAERFTTVQAAEFGQAEPGEPAGVKAKHRVIMGAVHKGQGTVAMMAPPHTGLYPLDRSNNYGFLQAGKSFIGTKMSYWGDKGYVPWVDAPQGATQRMDAFLVISPAGPRQTLARVLPYTHGDTFKSLPGYYVMAEHFHPELTLSHLNGQDRLTPFKETLKSLGVQIVQPLEFHLDQGKVHPINNFEDRLAECRAMYELFRQQSDTNFLLIPGEEYNQFFGGHWTYMFPRPVYFAGWRGDSSKSYKQTNVTSGGVTYPVVYQVWDAASMLQLLRDEGGIAWCAHPRVKDSFQMPDSYVDSVYYRDELFQAGGWKALPADLSKDRLGTRSFQLMDDTAQWGYRKYMVGEVDTFELDPSHEIYGHMDVNYLELPAFPSRDDWSSVVDCIRNGRFFTTTGELLIRKWKPTAEGVTADIEWCFPPSFAEIIWGDSRGVHRQRFSLTDQAEFGSRQISIRADLSAANWVRFEVWDVARNGGFTQPFWLRTPANPSAVAGTVTSFTLIDADTDAAVIGYDPIPENAVLERSRLPANLTIRANASPFVLSEMKLSLDGVEVARRTWPYCLSATRIGPGLRGCPSYDYQPAELSLGSHTLTATPSQGKTLGKALTLLFSVK